LLVAHDGGIAVLSAAVADWEAFRLAVIAELGPGAGCRVGVGGSCSVPADFARSDREARLALRVQAGLTGADQVSVFDDLANSSHGGAAPSHLGLARWKRAPIHLGPEGNS
jgi:hypothetical protein